MEMRKLYNGYQIPDVAFGTGVIMRYTRNPILYLKKSIKEVLSSVKHHKLNRNLKGDFFVRKYCQTRIMRDIDSMIRPEFMDTLKKG